MVESIRDRLFQRHFKKLTDQPQGKPVFASANELTSVTILTKSPFYTVEGMEDAVRYFRSKGILCQGYLVDRKTKEKPQSTDVDIITRQDVEWYGIPKKELLIKWLSFKTDLLIVINPDHSALLRYLCASSNCRLKAGIAYENKMDRHLDFHLESGNGNQTVKSLCKMIYGALVKVSQYET